MLLVNSSGHTAYQTFVLKNLRKYYPDPTVFTKSTWDIIERFWTLDLSYTDEQLCSKYPVFGSKQKLLPTYGVLICFLLILKSIPLPIGSPN